MNKSNQLDKSLTCVQDSYERAINQKLTDITETRTKQADKITLQQIHNAQPAPSNAAQPSQVLPIQNQGQIPQGFPNHQLQQPMRASGMGIPASVLPQQSQLPVGHSQMNLHQIQQKVHPQLLQHNSQPQLTSEENGMVNRIAHQMMQRTSEDQLNTIRNLIPPEQRRLFQARGVDPAVVYFRSGAIAKFHENRAKLANERNPPIPPSHNALISQQGRPQSQNTIPALSQQSNEQMFKPSFVAGSMNQIIGQQREAMRSQEAGQVVVPASTGQIVSDAQRGNIRTAPQQQQQPNVQLEGNFPSNQPSNVQYWPQNQNMQPSPHMRVPQPGLQFVHMPHSGFHSQQRMAPPNTSLPNINQTTSPKPQNAWPSQKSSPLTQSNDKEIASPQQITQQLGAAPLKPSNTGQNRQSAIPPQMQEHFATMSANMAAHVTANTGTNMNEEQKKLFVQRQMQIQTQRYLRQQQQNEAHLKGSQPENLDGKKVQGATQTNQSSHLISNTTMVNNNGIQQPAIAQQPAPPTSSQAQQSAPHDRAPNYGLNEEETRQMDNCNFPPSILNNTSGHYLSKLPPDLKTWGQLKSWAAQHETALPPVTLHKLRNLQGMHYQSLLTNSRRKAQMGQTQLTNTQGFPRPSAPTAPMVPQQNQRAPLPLANPPQSTISVGQSIPRPTIQDIQVFRAQFSERFVNLNDADIERILMKQRQDQVRNSQRPAQQPSQLNSHLRNLNQQNVQPNFPLPVNQTNISQSPNPQGTQSDQNPQPSAVASRQVPTNRQMQQLPGHGNTKGLKRNSDDDIVEVATQKDALTMPQSSTEPRLNASPNLQELPAGVYHGQRHLQAEHQRAVPPHVRFNQIHTEVMQNIHRRQPIQMDAHTRSLAVQQLAAAKEHLHRVEYTLPKFFTMTGDEDFVRRVIQAVCSVSLECELSY